MFRRGVLHALIFSLVEFSGKKKFSQSEELARLHFMSVTSAMEF